MEFGNPNQLVWLWLPLVSFGLVLWTHSRRMKRWQKFTSTLHEGIATHDVSRSNKWLRALLVAGAALMFVIAAAQPRWGFEWREVKTTGSDIMVAVDVSRSMLAEDVSPNRLMRAKREIIDLLRMVEGDRIGLIAFAGLAYVQCPLTIDYNAVSMFLDYIDDELIPVQGTAIGKAIDLATESLKEASDEFAKGRALILITDGEDHDPAAKQTIALAKDNGVKVFIIGVGSEEGAPIPAKGGGFKKDTNGNMIVSRLNESALREVAEATGGMFVRSVSGDKDLERIYFDGIRDHVDEQEFEEQRRRVWYERFQWFLLIGILLLLVEAFLPAGKRFAIRGTTGVVGLLVMLALGSPPEALAKGIRSAEKDFGQGNFEDAKKAFGELEVENPDEIKHTYNRGVSAYRDGDFKEAINAFKKSSQSEDPAIKEPSLFNLGNAYASQKQFDEAIAAYNDVLKSNPENQKARENLQYVEELKKMQQQNQQNQDQNQQNQDQNQQNQQNQDQNQQNQDQNQQNQQNQDQNQQNQQNQQGQQGQQSQQSENQNSDEQQQAGNQNKNEPKDQQASQDQKQNSSKSADATEQSQNTNGGDTARMSAEAAERLLDQVEDRGGRVMRGMIHDNVKDQQPPGGKDW